MPWLLLLCSPLPSKQDWETAGQVLFKESTTLEAQLVTNLGLPELQSGKWTKLGNVRFQISLADLVKATLQGLYSPFNQSIWVRLTPWWGGLFYSILLQKDSSSWLTKNGTLSEITISDNPNWANTKRSFSIVARDISQGTWKASIHLECASLNTKHIFPQVSSPLAWMKRCTWRGWLYWHS